MRKGPKGYFRNDSVGFTSLELLACITACALLLAVIAPILTTTRSRSDRVACMGNLRQIGNAFRQFGLEHNDVMPWRPQTIDSNFNQPGKHELWFQYWWLRDAIGSPRFLMDPAATRPNARVARSWDLNVNGGLQFLKNRAVSYVLGLDSSTEFPRSMLVADRNIYLSGYGGCSSQLSTAARVSLTWPSTGWVEGEVHRTFGNIALADGSVDSVNSEGLLRVVAESRDVGDAVHIMTAEFQ